MVCQGPLYLLINLPKSRIVQIHAIWFPKNLQGFLIKDRNSPMLVNKPILSPFSSSFILDWWVSRLKLVIGRCLNCLAVLSPISTISTITISISANFLLPLAPQLTCSLSDQLGPFSLQTIITWWYLSLRWILCRVTYQNQMIASSFGALRYANGNNKAERFENKHHPQ